AFGETVGANEDAARIFGAREIGNARFAVAGRQRAGDRVNGYILAENIAQVAGNVVGGVNEPAEDDGPAAIGEQSFDVPRGFNELLIRLAGELFGPPGESEQL